MSKHFFSPTLALIAVFGIFFLGSAFTVPIESEISPEINRWEKLGQRKVNYGLDRDQISVTARDGLFTALKLKVKNGGINLHRCVVHFRNGQTQALNIGQTIRAGERTRVLDLAGNRRVITKVVFWYDTKNFARNRGTVELRGRH